MKLQKNALLGFGLILFIMSCQNQTKSSEKSTNTLAADSAKFVAQKIWEYTNKLDFKTVFQYYSNDSDTRYIENGYLFPSLSALKESYIQITPNLEYYEISAKSWDMIELNNDAVLVNIPSHAKIKAKDRPEYEFDYVWSAVIQKRRGKWLVVQSHESWINAPEVAAAFTPTTASTK